jgi:hypothetical protein
VDLLNFWVVSAAEKWTGFREAGSMLDTCSDIPSVDYSTLSKKAKEVPYKIIRDVFQLLLTRTTRSLRRKFLNKYKIYAIDSTMITFKHPNLSWARYSSHRHAIRIHTKYDVDESMPAQIIETTGRDQDIMVAPKLFLSTDILAIQTADRGYASTAFFEKLHNENQHFVIRIADFFTTTKCKSLQRLKISDSNIIRDETAYIGKGTRTTKNRFRLVTFLDDEGNKIRVATNVMDCSAEIIAQIYKLRWQIELFFRWLKQNLDLSKLFGMSENAVYSQVFGTLISYLLLRWLYNETKSAWEFVRKLTFLDFSRRFIHRTLPIEVNAEIHWFFNNRGSLYFSSGRI